MSHSLQFEANVRQHNISVFGRYVLLPVLLMLLSLSSYAVEIATETISVSDEIDVDVSIYPAEGDVLFIWLACNQGSEGAETRSAAVLVEHGIEVWLPDMLSAHFLPPGPSSIYNIPGEEIAVIIDAAIEQTGKKFIYLVAGGRAAAPLLRGAVAWEKQHGENSQRLSGALLIYPRLTLLKPEPGTEPVYIEAVGEARLPIVILEGERTPNRWGLPHLSAAFRKNSVFVHSALIPKVRGYFYVRNDATPAEQAMSRQLPHLLMSHLSDFKR